MNINVEMRDCKNRKKIKPSNICYSGTEKPSTSSSHVISKYMAQLSQYRNGHIHEHVHNAKSTKLISGTEEKPNFNDYQVNVLTHSILSL